MLQILESNFYYVVDCDFPLLMQVTRVRNISSCSEDGEDPLVID